VSDQEQTVVDEKEPVVAQSEDNAEPSADVDDVQSGTESQPATDQQPLPKRNKTRERIERLLSDKHRLQGELEAYKAMVAEKGSPSGTPPSDGKPLRELYASDDEFHEALTDWKLDQRMPEIEERIQGRQVQRAAEHDWEERVAAARASHDDWDDVQETANGIVMPKALLDSIVQSEVGAELVYALGKDPANANRIARLPAMTAAREIGRMEATLLDHQPVGNNRNVTRAPAPITPVNAGTSKIVKSPDDMTDAEYFEWRRTRKK
jgi:hypothetical protein